MRIDILTIFPSLINSFVNESLIGKAQESGRLEISALDIREGASGVHKAVDDTPFGGGPGMVLKPDPIFNVVENKNPPRPLYLLSPAGEPFSHSKAKELSKLDGFSLLCGRYEGVDQRVRDHLIDGEISLGDLCLLEEKSLLWLLSRLLHADSRRNGQSRICSFRIIHSGIIRIPTIYKAMGF